MMVTMARHCWQGPGEEEAQRDLAGEDVAACWPAEVRQWVGTTSCERTLRPHQRIQKYPFY
jgi:hypothetical protein